MIITKEQIKKILREDLKEFGAAVMLTESSGNSRANRFEPLVYEKYQDKNKSTSWGLFQIMGYHLENFGLNLKTDLEKYLNNINLQVISFHWYYDKYLKGKSNNALELYALYNGGQGALNTKIKTGKFSSQVQKHVDNFASHYTGNTGLFLFIGIVGAILYAKYSN